ncbi:MAG TPA: hypothetical protein VIM65_21635 [Cyclobacteriaceae bacterium]
MQTYFEKDFFVISCDKNNEVIVVEWKTPPTSQEFKDSMNVVVEALQYFNTGKVIFDTVALGVLLDADQEWISSDWYVRAVKVGYSRVAFVLPKDAFTDMFVKETVKRTSDRIPTAYFENRMAAIEWMNEV